MTDHDPLAVYLDGETQEVSELRRALRTAQQAAVRKRVDTEALTAAVYEAARDAFLAHGPARKIVAPTADKRAKGPEAALLHLTDWQLGKKSISYDMDKCRDRVGQALTKTVELSELQRSHHPVRELHVMFGGDMIEGVSIFPGQAFEVEAAAFEQVVATGKLCESVVADALEHFEHVHVWEEIGNHGRLGRKGDHPHGDNMDRLAYTLARNVLGGHERVTWHAWDGALGTHVHVGAYTALLFHGDEIKSFGGNCVTPDVRVLTRDLRWVPAGELQVGDSLLAFDEYGAPVRHYAEAEVTATGIHERDVWRISFADGSSVRCTPEHPWIVAQTDRQQGGTNRQVWMTPPEIAARLTEGGRSHTGAGVWMFQPVAPWDAPTRDYDSGMLAGAFDADGCLANVSNGSPRWPTADFAQYPNALLSSVKLALETKGFAYKERTKRVSNGKREDIHSVELGRDDTLRFLGQMRPARLLERWSLVDVSLLTFTRKSVSGLKQIVSCEPDGRAEICALTSSTGTYITEHGPAHNTPAFGILRKLNAWASGVIAPFQDAYGGHFHTPMTLTMANAGRIFMTGSPESDNEYAREFVAAVGKPSQRLHFVDPDRGRVTTEYTLWLD